MANTLNHVQVLKENLEFKVKETITESLVKKQLEEYEKELRMVIKGLVEQISFSHIEQIKNHLKQREEYSLWIKWNDEESKNIESDS